MANTNSADYKAGYNFGWKMVQSIIDQLSKNGGGTDGGPGGGNPINDIDQINGLDPIVPNFPVNNTSVDGDQKQQKTKSNNTPVNISPNNNQSTVKKNDSSRTVDKSGQQSQSNQQGQ